MRANCCCQLIRTTEPTICRILNQEPFHSDTQGDTHCLSLNNCIYFVTSVRQFTFPVREAGPGCGFSPRTLYLKSSTAWSVDRCNMDFHNILKVAAGVALGLGTCTLVAFQGRTQDSLELHLFWKDAPSGLPALLLICIVAGLSVVATHRLYKLLFCPLELLRAPEDVGYITEDGRSKAQAANEVRRRRKLGELPPVYPNGWYRVLDSHLLGRGEVKNVSVLGMLLLLLNYPKSTYSLSRPSWQLLTLKSPDSPPPPPAQGDG